MKKLYTLIVLFIATTGLFAQINAPVIDPIPNTEFGCFSIANTQLPTKVTMKAAQIDRELLDSIVSLDVYDGVIYDGNKSELEYDANGNKTYESSYYWDTDAIAWQGFQRVDSLFNANGYLSVSKADSWNKETRQWMNYTKYESSYNAKGELIITSAFSWNNDTGEWKYISKQEKSNTYSVDNVHNVFSINYVLNDSTGEWTPTYANELNYDPNGNLLLYNASLWESATNSWVFINSSFKYEYAYDEKGNRTLNSYYRWNEELDQWIGQNKLIESSYDSFGNTTMKLYKEWDETLNQWENIEKTVSSYSANGLVQSNTFKWVSSSGDWLALDQTENNYNENGTLSKATDSEWNVELNVWVGISQSEYIYDAKGNLSQSNSLQIDTISGEWIVDEKTEYKYNADNKKVLEERFALNTENQDMWDINYKMQTIYDVYENVISETTSALNELGVFGKISENSFIYNQSGDKLLENSLTIYYGDEYLPFYITTNYYYSIHSTTSSIDKKLEATTIYPNPFSDQLSFHLNNNSNQAVFELFNLQGRKVMSKRISGSESINTSNLNSGIYIYILLLDGKMQSGKLMKK